MVGGRERERVTCRADSLCSLSSSVRVADLRLSSLTPSSKAAAASALLCCLSASVAAAARSRTSCACRWVTAAASSDHMRPKSKERVSE